jgi:hypothetical protein
MIHYFPISVNFREALQRYKNQKVNILVVRSGDTVKLPLTVPAEGKIGVYPKDLSTFFKLKEKSYNIITAVPTAFTMTFEKTGRLPQITQIIVQTRKGI